MAIFVENQIRLLHVDKTEKATEIFERRHKMQAYVSGKENFGTRSSERVPSVRYFCPGDILPGCFPSQIRQTYGTSLRCLGTCLWECSCPDMLLSLH